MEYEKLTINKESETRRFINELGLGWDKACLSPHLNKSCVRKASQMQVRGKVYQGSFEAFSKYEQYLNNAFDGPPSS